MLGNCIKWPAGTAFKDARWSTVWGALVQSLEHTLKLRHVSPLAIVQHSYQLTVSYVKAQPTANIKSGHVVHLGLGVPVDGRCIQYLYFGLEPHVKWTAKKKK